MTTAELEQLRDWARDHDPGRHAIAMACSLLLGDGSSRTGAPTPGQIERAERTVRNGWAEMVGEQADDAPTIPRTKTGRTEPIDTPTSKEIAAAHEAEWERKRKEGLR